MPDLPSQSGNEAPQEEVIVKLEGTLVGWVSAIQTALSHEADRSITGKGQTLHLLLQQCCLCFLWPTPAKSIDGRACRASAELLNKLCP